MNDRADRSVARKRDDRQVDRGVVRRSSTGEAAAAISRMVWSVDPNQPISNVQTLDEIVAHGTEARRIR